MHFIQTSVLHWFSRCVSGNSCWTCTKIRGFKKKQKTLSSFASRSNSGFCLDERHACGAWAGLQMSTVHSYRFVYLHQFHQQLEETQLLIWVEAAASVALVVYWTSCSLNPWELSCIVIFCYRGVGDNQISVSRDQRDSICVVYIRNNPI